MSDPIKVTYDDVEITYLEQENKWNFVLRGRERNAESLAHAKEWIDKPEPGSKKNFDKIPAFQKTYSSNPTFIPVEITSVADGRSYRSEMEMWVFSPKLGRKKVGIGSLYADTKTNRELIADYEKAEMGIAQIHDTQKNIQEKMTKVEEPKL